MALLGQWPTGRFHPAYIIYYALRTGSYLPFSGHDPTFRNRAEPAIREASDIHGGATRIGPLAFWVELRAEPPCRVVALDPWDYPCEEMLPL